MINIKSFKILKLFILITLIFLCLFFIKCRETSDTDNKNNSIREHRTFYMAAAPFRLVETETSIKTVFEFKGFKVNIDLVSLHTDNFFGVPWDEFRPSGKRNNTWHNMMKSIKTDINNLEVGVYLSITPINGTRNSIAARALQINGQLVVDDDWYSECYNFNTGLDAQAIKTAYLNYVRWMVDFFKPKYLTHGIEINMYKKSCPDCYKSLISLLNKVYEQEKSRNPQLVIFPTFTASDLWSYGEQGECSIGDRRCLIDNLDAQKKIKRDRFGISAYPLFLQWEWKNIQEDYFSAIAEETGEKIVFGETGQGSNNVTVPFPEYTDPCFTLFHSSDEEQIEYMKFLFNNAQYHQSDLVVWWSLRDYLFEQILTNCPCNAPGLWCVAYEYFGTQTNLLSAWLMWGSMGILDYNGFPKKSFYFWHKWFNKKKIN